MSMTSCHALYFNVFFRFWACVVPFTWLFMDEYCTNKWKSLLCYCMRKMFVLVPLDNFRLSGDCSESLIFCTIFSSCTRHKASYGHEMAFEKKTTTMKKHKMFISPPPWWFQKTSILKGAHSIYENSRHIKEGHVGSIPCMRETTDGLAILANHESTAQQRTMCLMTKPSP